MTSSGENSYKGKLIVSSMENILNPAFLSLCLQFYVSFGEEHCIEGSVTVSSLKVRL